MLSSPFMLGSDFNSLLDQFRLALEDCRQLYLTSGRECAEYHPNLIKGRPSDFVRVMDDLHKGLLTKIYFTVAGADFLRHLPADLQSPHGDHRQAPTEQHGPGHQPGQHQQQVDLPHHCPAEHDRQDDQVRPSLQAEGGPAPAASS